MSVRERKEPNSCTVFTPKYTCMHIKSANWGNFGYLQKNFCNGDFHISDPDSEFWLIIVISWHLHSTVRVRWNSNEIVLNVFLVHRDVCQPDNKSHHHGTRTFWMFVLWETRALLLKPSLSCQHASCETRNTCSASDSTPRHERANGRRRQQQRPRDRMTGKVSFVSF